MNNLAQRYFGIDPMTGQARNIAAQSPYSSIMPSVSPSRQTGGLTMVAPMASTAPVVPQAAQADSNNPLASGNMGDFTGMLKKLAQPGLENVNKIDAERKRLGMDPLGFMDRMAGITGIGDQPFMPLGPGGFAEALRGAPAQQQTNIPLGLFDMFKGQPNA